MTLNFYADVNGVALIALVEFENVARQAVIGIRRGGNGGEQAADFQRLDPVMRAPPRFAEPCAATAASAAAPAGNAGHVGSGSISSSIGRRGNQKVLKRLVQSAEGHLSR